MSYKFTRFFSERWWSILIITSGQWGCTLTTSSPDVNSVDDSNFGIKSRSTNVHSFQRKGFPVNRTSLFLLKNSFFSLNKKERKMLGKLIAFETPRITKTKHLQFPWLEVWRQMSFSIYIAIKIYINQYWKKLKQYNKKIRKALKIKTFLIIRFIYKDIRHCVVTIRL